MKQIKLSASSIKLSHIKILMILISLIIITACSAATDNKKAGKASQQVITVTKTKHTSSFYFAGIIAPIQINVVSSPIDGTVDRMYFNYGQQLKKGQLLLKLKSATLGKNYQQAVSSYLTAKEKYNTSKSNIIGAKDLYDAGITSRQTFEAAQSDLSDSYLSFLQAQLALLELLRSAGISQHDLYLLQINDEAAVKKALQTPLKAISIYASMNGIALKPIKSDGSGGGGSDSGQIVHVGSELKTGQVIASIGEMSGIKISINVDEIRINQLKFGDPAIVTSDAFPGIKLFGTIVAMSSQANTDDSGGLPTFPVVVAVKNITAAEQQVIHVGMSAKVQVDSASADEIVIPIQAVQTVNNNTYVTLIDPSTGKTVQQMVQVGPTTVNGISIINGLKSGDKLVVSN